MVGSVKASTEPPQATCTSFGAMLRQRRQALQLTQQALAALIGIDPTTLRRLESDAQRPSQPLAAALADALGVPTAERELFLREAFAVSSSERIAVIPQAAGSASAVSLHIQVLGTFRVSDAQGAGIPFVSARVQTLLGYLLLHRHAPQTRQQVAFALWPDSSEPQARSNLRGLLRELRHALPTPDAFLDAAGQSVQWRPGSASNLDIESFEAAVTQAAEAARARNPVLERSALDSALAAYRGELLPGQYEDWVLVERERLQQHYGEVLAQRAALSEADGDLHAAVDYAKLLLRVDSLREEVYRRLMRLHGLRGDRAAVLQKYNSCASILRKELGLEPSLETRQAYAEALSQSATPRQPRMQAPPAIPNNLPPQLTSFIGRETVLTELRQLLTTTHLLTLTGAGGSGKTRLSIKVAADVLDTFKDGVWFVELAPVSDPALIAQTVASVLGVREQPGFTILQLLVEFLRARQLLLILDNCEHLVEACARFADTLLRTASGTKILATSREALSIAGEQIYLVPTLQLSEPYGALPLEALAQVESVRLFAERALAVQPQFVMTGAHAQSVAQICRRLDGIPLAIELAAARVKSLPVEQINQKMDDRFRLLTGGSRTALPRHQTLRALIDWSYNLLSAPEQLLLCRLSVFAGGWTLDAAETICSDERLPRAEILNGLTHLADKSLLLLDERGDDADGRYRMLETIRQYAHERLLASVEGARLRSRHLEYFMHWAEESEPKLKGAQQLAWRKQWELESDNVRAALDWSADNSVEAGLRLANASTWFWWLSTRWSEGRVHLERLLSRCDRRAAPFIVRALYRASYLSVFSNDPLRGQALAREALVLSQECGDPQCLADATFYLGLAMNQFLDYQGLRRFEESLTRYRALDDKWGVAVALLHIGHCQVLFNQADQARIVLLESLSIFRHLSDGWGQAITLGTLGNAARRLGDHERAQAIYEEQLPIAEALDNQLEIARALNGLGWADLARGRYAEAVIQCEASLKVQESSGILIEYEGTTLPLGLARLHLGQTAAAVANIQESLTRFHSRKHHQGISACLDAQAAVSLELHQPERAVQLSAASETLLESIHGLPLPEIVAERTHTAAAAREQLSESEFTAAWTEGHALTLEQAIALAEQVVQAAQAARMPVISPHMVGRK